MALKMKYIVLRNGMYYVVRPIPQDVLKAFPNPVFKRSLRTRERHEAAKKALPIIEALDKAIEDARRPAAHSRQPAMSVGWQLIDPETALAAVERWRDRAIREAYVFHFNGAGHPLVSVGPERADLMALINRLRFVKWREIDDFDARLVAALRSGGVQAEIGHPILQNLRLPFAKSWRHLEEITLAFRAGDFSGWDGDLEATTADAQDAPPGALGDVKATSSVRISDLLARFVASKMLSPKDEREVRYYVRRLIEFGGDVAISDVTTDFFDRFLVELRRFPVTQRPDIMRLDFNDIIARHGVADAFGGRKLANKTIRTKWFGAYNRLFKYAVTLKALAHNPLVGAIPSKRHDDPSEREQWSPDELKALFSLPLFNGTMDAGDEGYRKEPGPLLRKDAKYWLPIISLWSGLRLDEIGAMRAEEMREHNGVWVFDLSKRPIRGDRRLKNANARRIVPVHSKLMELGMLEYHQAQTEWLFPEIWESKRPREPATAGFSKWFGLWRAENGFSERWKDFHAFRHTFKEACREAGIAEDVHDRLTGHGGRSDQETGRSYGKSDIKFLKSTIDRVEFPTFPILSTV